MAGSRRLFLVVTVLFLAFVGLPGAGLVQQAAAQIAVSSADPPTGQQGTLNMSVIIKGKGFKSGARAEFYRTGTTDPAGVKVKSTQVVSSTQLIATIDIDGAAELSLFDIEVANTDGRTGKGTELFRVTTRVADVPLNVFFSFVKSSATTCVGGPAWCGDGQLYQSDSGERYLVAKIHYYDFRDSGTAGGFSFLVSGANAGRLAFDFRQPVVDPLETWCPEVCPDAPQQPLPDFAADPITAVDLFDQPLYSPPNYDFFNPGVCNAGLTADGFCPNDSSVSIQTASRKEYRLRYSPNIWRQLALPNTFPGGVMAVRYDGALDSWTLRPLTSHPAVLDDSGAPATDPCPVVLERKDVAKSRTTWVFLGCYDMPFELTLTKR